MKSDKTRWVVLVQGVEFWTFASSRIEAALNVSRHVFEPFAIEEGEGVVYVRPSVSRFVVRPFEEVYGEPEVERGKG
jgi:hypothetical protein